MAGSPLSKMPVSENSGAWFHCCHCGKLFKAPADPDTRGPCAECGHDPVTGAELQADSDTPARVRRRVRKHGESPHHHQHKAKRSRHARKKARVLMYFVAAWVALVAFAAIFLKRGSTAAPTPAPDYVEKSDAPSIDDLQFLQDHMPECSDRVVAFLNSTDPAGRAQQVLRAEQLIPRMTRYYESNPALPVQESLSIPYRGVIKTPAGRAIESIWRRGNGELLEAVFFEEKGEWKIDWDAMVRYSSEPWALFLAAQGPGEGEFRLLARERLGAGGHNDESIGLVFYRQRPGFPGETLNPSPEVRVVRASALGRAIEDAFKARQEKVAPFGSRAFENDPDGMIRLRVKMSRSGDETRVFKIEELLATHWLDLPSTPIKAGE